VVASAVGEGPAVGVAAGIGVRGAAEVQTSQAHAADTRDRARGRVAVAIIGDAVGRDANHRIGLGDAVLDRTAGIVVVAGAVGEGPAVGVAAGVGVGGAAEVQTSQAHAADTGDRARGRVAVAIIGDAVGRDANHRIGLGDAVANATRGLVVVASAVGEGPA